MGDGGHIPRAVIRRLIVVASCSAACLASAACVDLAEPNLPSLNSSTVFNITVRQIPGQPVIASGSLAPGRDSIGVPRRVLTPLFVLNRAIDIGQPNAQRTFVIQQNIVLDSASFVGPFEIQPPIVENSATPTIFRWYGMRRLDGDTVRTDAVGDVALHVQTEFGTPGTPTPSRQWFLELTGAGGSIHVSGDGTPPQTIRVPVQFIPMGAGNRVDATLIYFQSATVVNQPVPYISSATLDVRTQWVILKP
jgi:hypothetical protein